MSNINNHRVEMKHKISVVLAGTILAFTGFTLPSSANVSNTITQKEISGQPETLVRTLQQGKSQNTPTGSQNRLQFQLVQTHVGGCVVSVQSGSLRVRQNPSTNSRTIALLKNGTRVGLGVTDGSEGNSWTRIVYPFEGYVASAYLKNCHISQKYL
ncbi:SH3 domain-containing protein [Sphaerospermopsis aphanizomenoides BCCUSP55]|uniref:SH3 domain-containing protein n=1 Tax=Sphaerospermopsis aphanizomenoides TaxID=459663 RepID=UPI001907C825|nr:SH3 domain-containing protein [Sphaerospermopsis aphanizomenoides]MBK1987640.1 SH3 domain-containing protein [Sphaerospermopsis aphanizomenoides BCCUSP55]